MRNTWWFIASVGLSVFFAGPTIVVAWNAGLGFVAISAVMWSVNVGYFFAKAFSDE